MRKFLFPLLSLVPSFALYAESGASNAEITADPHSRGKNARQVQQQPQPMQEFWQGDDPLCNQPAGYSYPAAVKLACGYNVSLTASYLYWFVGEEGLDLATTAVFNTLTNTAVAPAAGGTVVLPDFSYTSGFKAGLAWTSCCDEWIWRADYTWVNHDTQTSQTAPALSGGVGAFYLTDWFYQTSAQNQGVVVSSLDTHWKLSLQWLDAVIERPYYSGKKLTLNPFFGLRASWIKQSLSLAANGVLNFTPPQPTVSSSNHSNSWGIGPRAGVGAHYLLSRQIRFQAAAAGNLLYTKYTKISHSEGALATGGSGVAFSSDRSALRSSVEGSLGLGWGRYFKSQRYHFDLSATYDFNYLWSQNMVRFLNDLSVIGVGSCANDLYLHGLTVTAVFDF